MPREVPVKPSLKLITPATVNRTVAGRKPNASYRAREYLTDAEVARLQAAAKGNRNGHRDATMILVAYRHGLRASELVDLRWDQVDFNTANMASPTTATWFRSGPCGGCRRGADSRSRLCARSSLH